MSDTEKMISEALDRIQTLLKTERVVGEPIQIGTATVVPLVSIGFAFGSGSGTEARKTGPSGGGQGVGGGGGIKPVALVVSDEHGVRVEPVKQSSSSLADSVAKIIKQVADERAGDKNDRTGTPDTDAPAS